jgi:Icc-related predicted phosphoesterase
MRCVIISDTHNQLDKIKLPSGDLLIHAGDWTMGGKLEEIAKFNYDLQMKLEYGFRLGAIVTAGNHDFLMEKHPNLGRSVVRAGRYLQDEGIEIEGLKFYGSPWQPEFLAWAFNLARGAEIKTKWDLIPEDTDVLITHGPPAGILDEIPNGERVGCQDLMNTVKRIKPKYHVFGHIHHSYGVLDMFWNNREVTTFINASICTERYKPTNEPIVIEI